MPDPEPDPIPDELWDRPQWLLWDNSHNTPRQPHWDGEFHGISWSDPDDWHPAEEAIEKARSEESWGIGYVTAVNSSKYDDGEYGVLDLDGVRDEDGSPKDWLPSLEPFFERDAYMEFSPSGDGIHIPVRGLEKPDWFTDTHFSADEHEGIEALCNKFCTFTGDALIDCAGNDVVEHGDWLDDWLAEVLTAINGSDPRDDGDREYSEDDEYLDEDDIRDALDHISPDVTYNTWRDIGFALQDFFESESTALRVFKDWSRGGSKWDDEAEDYAERIIKDSDPSGGRKRTIATVIHHARQGGWEMPDPPQTDSRDPEDYDDRPEDDDEPDWEKTWSEIWDSYQYSQNSDEKASARHSATMKLCREMSFATHMDRDVVYVYDEEQGVYEEYGEQRVHERLVEKLGHHYSRTERNEILSQIKGRSFTRSEEFGGPAGTINLQNGVLDLLDNELRDHNPDDMYISQLPVNYDPEAECPRWEEFVQESVARPVDVYKLQEYVGYTLMHWAMPFQKALFLVGPTASGKSTFLDTVRALLGPDTVSSVTPQELVDERFSAVELFGAWANIRNDIPSGMIENTGKFKELTAGDPIKAEEKYQDTFTFEPTAKHLYSTNQLPEASVDDDAFYRRIMLVSFPTTVPQNERNPDLTRELKEELPGILNWALEGLDRLRQRREFTGARNPGKVRETWEKWGSSVERFKSECLEEEPGEAVPKKVAWAAYLEFCDEEGLPAVSSQNKLTRRLTADPEIDQARRRFDGTQKRSYTNIRLIDEWWPGDDDGDDDDGDGRSGNLDDYGTDI